MIREDLRIINRSVTIRKTKTGRYATRKIGQYTMTKTAIRDEKNEMIRDDEDCNTRGEERDDT